MTNEVILVLDFGGQYKQLIARAVRACNVYSVIKPGTMTAAEVKEMAPIGIIFTGGPNSVYLKSSHKCDPEILNLGIPILGICYGMHLLCYMEGGNVISCDKGEFGRIKASTDSKKSAIFKNISREINVLMSHNDKVEKLPPGFISTASTANCENAACENAERKLYAVQFHPETDLTDNGTKIIDNFLYKICGASGEYKLGNYLDEQIDNIKKTVGNERVLLALSGGLDSSVCAYILLKAIPKNLVCIFIDHGLMRLGEGDEIERVFKDKELNFIRVNAEQRFLKKLKSVTDPEKKRKIIGNEFIKVFEEEALKLGDIRYLAQGTIYPDVIESGGEMGAVIKSHHNVGGLPETLSFKEIIEPLSGLFKDEVRLLGKDLGLPDMITNRQPFPGPGLAVRIMGEVTKSKLDMLREADSIMRDEIARLRIKPNQYFAVLTGTRSVGVKGDSRTYDNVIALRAVITNDFMTCQYAPLSHKTLSRIASRITSEIKGVSRVVYDITSKPPATVEWE